MSGTARTLRAAAHAANYHGLQSGPRFIDTDGRLDLVAAIYLGATGRTPHALGTSNDPTNPFNDLARLLIETNEDVMNAIRAVSIAIGTEPPTDSETGEPCLIEHLWYWQIDRRMDTGTPPTAAETVGLLLRAANAEYARTGTLAVALPSQRAA
ncbi:hypothetical protein ACFWG5_34265 [Streptomyces hydrogenans]|uniref:hypothetical protein n=1 Tax=Streptomyces TaxID=1883 RepID=UPI0036410FFA